MSAIILQCGGPTPVINASLAGIIEGLRRVNGNDHRVLGSRLAFRGLLQRDLADLSSISSAELQALKVQPGCALGSGRDLLDDADIPKIFETLNTEQIRAIYLVGGNGTMAAADKLHNAAREQHLELRVVGIPKTIDNDLHGTDVCPGFGSAARHIAQSVRDAALDLHSMRNFDDVVVFETMGRHTGWLAAASALATWSDTSPPHILLLPEVPVDEARLLDRIGAQHARTGTCFVVAAEGAQDTDGHYLAEKGEQVGIDESGQRLLSLSGGLATYLASRIRQELRLRCRIIRPDTTQRSTTALASDFDREIAFAAGLHSTDPVVASGTMVSLRLTDDAFQTGTAPLGQVIGRTRKIPHNYFDRESCQPGVSLIRYLQRVTGYSPPKPILP
jgi:6-phosphofructokinase 1